MRGSLSRRVLGLVLLNLILIAAVLAAFAQWQFGLSVESLLLGPARDRIGSIANAIARNLDSTPYQGRAALLSSYSARYGADIFLVTPFGESLTGSEVILPPALMDRLRGGTGPMDGDDLDPEGPAAGPPGRGRGLPREKAFLTITRQPLLYWVGVRIPTPGPDGERGIPGVLLLRTNSVFNSRLFFGWRSLVLLAMALGSAALVCWVP